MARFRLDPKAPPSLTDAERARLDAMSEADIDAAADGDVDNPPLDAMELERLEGARFVRAVRLLTGLSQSQFANTYRINPARLRDLEQGRTRPDSALRAYLTVIARRPEVVTALEVQDVDGGPGMDLAVVRSLRERVIETRRAYEHQTEQVRRSRRGPELDRLFDAQDAAREAWAKADQLFSDYLGGFEGR
jgi:putative transcriptional regulator